MKIGIFDSGIGGLSVLHEAWQLLRGEEYIFYADVDHVPYGLKTREQILGYSRDIVDFLEGEGADVVLIACNTATAVAASDLRKEKKIPIIGMEPAVRPALKQNMQAKRVLVMATPVTIHEKKLKNLLAEVDQSHEVDLMEMPGLVKLAEAESFDTKEAEDYISSRLSSVDISDYSALVLGCTHFNYFKPLLRKYLGPDVRFVDGNEGTVRHLADVTGRKIYEDRITEKDPKVTYYMSGRPAAAEELSKLSRLHDRLEAVRCIS